MAKNRPDDEQARVDEEARLQTTLSSIEDQMANLLVAIENRAATGPFDAKACGRWIALARTHAETFLMFAQRGIDAPTSGIGVRR